MQSIVKSSSGTENVFLCSSTENEGHDKVWIAVRELWDAMDIRSKRIACRQFWFEEKTRVLLNKWVSEKYSQDIDHCRKEIENGKMTYIAAIRSFRRKLQ